MRGFAGCGAFSDLVFGFQWSRMSDVGVLCLVCWAFMMPRPPRLQFPGAIYHIVTRGDGRRAVFHDDGHYARFTNGLADEVQRSAWDVIAYCWMPNHIPCELPSPIWRPACNTGSADTPTGIPNVIGAPDTYSRDGTSPSWSKTKVTSGR